MKALTIIFFLALFLLLRPNALESGSFWYNNDDHDYFAHATSIAFGQFPRYDKECFSNKGLPLGSVGTGLMASPFVFLFSLPDRILRSDIVNQRTQDTILNSWSLYGFFVSTICFFWLGCALLYKGLRYHFSSKAAIGAIVLLILFQGLPLFAFRRPVFSHIFEFFLQSTMVYLFLRSIKEHLTWALSSYKRNILLGILCGLIVLVRHNNILIALVWPVVLAQANWTDIKKPRFWIYLGTIFGIMAGLILLFKIWPEMLVPNASTYLDPNGGAVQRLGQIHSPIFYIQRIFTVLLGLDWGLIYTAPFACIALVLMARPKSNIDRTFLWLLVPLIVNLYCILNWQTQGGWYGYRYIIASLFPLLLYPLAQKLEYIQTLPTRVRYYLAIAIIATLPILSMICFESSGGHFNLYFQDDLGYGNTSFQHQIWKTFLFKPGTILTIILQSGPTYLLHILQNILYWLHLSVKPYFDEYPSFNLTTLFKTTFLYALPFLMHWIWSRLHKKNLQTTQHD